MEKEKTRWCSIVIGVLILLVSLATYAQSAPAAAPFKVAIVTSITGPGYGYGQRGTLGARFRIEEEINKAGGINGHPVQLTIYDTTTKGDQAAMLAERAIAVDKVFAILGANASTDVASVFPTCNRLQVPNIAFGGTIRGWCEKNAPWCFSAMLSDDFWMEPLTLLLDKHKPKSIAVMSDIKYVYAVTQAEWGYKIIDRKGVKLVHPKGKLDVETNWPDFTPQITEIKSLKPDLLSAILYGPDLAHLMIALKGAGIGADKLISYAAGVLQPEAIEPAGEAAEGWYGTADFNPQSADPVQQAWLKKVTDYGKAITNDPGIYTAQTNTSCGYDAAAFLCEAIRRAKITPDTPLQEARSKIRDELPKIKMKTLSSEELSFGEGGKYEKNRLVKPAFLFQVQGRKLIPVGFLK